MPPLSADGSVAPNVPPKIWSRLIASRTAVLLSLIRKAPSDASSVLPGIISFHTIVLLSAIYCAPKYDYLNLSLCLDQTS